MNHQSQFARSTPGADAKAADTRPSLLPVSAAPIIDDQTWTDTERGRALYGTCRSAPAHLGQGRAHVRFAGSNGKTTLLRFTCRPVRPVGPFVLRGGCSRHLAINHTLRDCRLKCVAKGLPSHSDTSSRSSTYASKIAQKRGQDRGFFSQGRGNVTRGKRGADD